MVENSRPIIVAVGGDGAAAGVTFAAAEARGRHRPLHLVHVLRVSADDAYGLAYGGAVDGADRCLRDAMARARTLVPSETTVTGECVHTGWVHEELVSRSEDASLLVLQHRDLARARRVLGGSVVASVAARASCPVVSVRESWSAPPEPGGVVTAAVQDVDEASDILGTAFSEAESRGAEVNVLHAWWLNNGYDAVVADEQMRLDYERRAVAEIRPVLDAVGAAHPGVLTSVSVRHAPPVEAVLDAGETSGLLVLGRRHHLLPLMTHLGPVVRAALERSACPVLVVPEPSTRQGTHAGARSTASAT